MFKMEKEFSIYLDLFRFVAALIVFLSHYASQDLSGGVFWQLKPYSQTAVIAFFVLSGFVIGLVTDTKEKDASSYFISRISRLYSIVIPALVLTAICDFIGLYYNGEFYTLKNWDYPDGSQITHYFLSFFMVQNIWNLNLNPGINGPFWSLTYEWIFYITYGVFKFSRSFMKWPIILIILAFAGPSIISLFPAWLIGLFIYKAVRNSNFQQLRVKSLGIPIYLLTIVALAAFSPIVRSINFENSIYLRASLLGDYFDALVFAIHIFFASYMSFTLQTNLLRFEKTIRWLGTLTFALYLFHRPILQTFAALFESYIGDLWYNVSLFFIVFLIVCTLGRFCEKQKSLIKAKLNKYVVGFQH